MIKSTDIDLVGLKKRGPTVYNVMSLLKKHLEKLEHTLPDFHKETFRGQILLLSARIEFLFGESLDFWVFGESVSKSSGSLANLPLERKTQILNTLGLIDETEKKLIGGLRALRNDLAHSMSTDLDSLVEQSDVRALADSFSFSNSPFNTQQRLNFSTIILTGVAHKIYDFCTTVAVNLPVSERQPSFQKMKSEKVDITKELVEPAP